MNITREQAIGAYTERTGKVYNMIHKGHGNKSGVIFKTEDIQVICNSEENYYRVMPIDEFYEDLNSDCSDEHHYVEDADLYKER